MTQDNIEQHKTQRHKHCTTYTTHSLLTHSSVFPPTTHLTVIDLYSADQEERKGIQDCRFRLFALKEARGKRSIALKAFHWRKGIKRLASGLVCCSLISLVFENVEASKRASLISFLSYLIPISISCLRHLGSSTRRKHPSSAPTAYQDKAVRF